MKKRSMAILVMAGCLAWPSAGAAKTMSPGIAHGGATSAARGDSPAFRYLALSPGRGPEDGLTIVERIDRERATIDRWWRLRGTWYLPAVAYDGSGASLSANGRFLALQRFSLRQETLPAPRVSSFAILDTALHLRHPARPGQERPAHAVARVRLRGDFDLAAISPRGRTLYLTKFGSSRDGGHLAWSFRIRAYDTVQRRLLPVPLAPPLHPVKFRGLPVSSVAGPEGWRYTLYDDGRGGVGPYVLALDTRSRRLARIPLPELANERQPMMMRLRIGDSGRGLEVISASSPRGTAPESTLLQRLPIPPTESALGTEPEPNRAASEGRPSKYFLAFTETPRNPPGPAANVLGRLGIAGHSAEGRPIRLKQMGDPALDGVLVFGCIHGDECAGREVLPLANGCPDPHSNVFLVPSLDPDGFAAGTRLNGRGVDLNRNFAAGWQARGERGDPEYSGPRPFSEPETRLAARIVDRLRPEATIWFHQHWASRPLVRAFGGSVADGRRFAALARMPFKVIPWPAGTGPHWQNRRFPGASSFVVELPRGPLATAMRSRLDKALLRFAREVGED